MKIDNKSFIVLNLRSGFYYFIFVIELSLFGPFLESIGHKNVKRFRLTNVSLAQLARDQISKPGIVSVVDSTLTGDSFIFC